MLFPPTFSSELQSISPGATSEINLQKVVEQYVYSYYAAHFLMTTNCYEGEKDSKN